MSQRTIKQLITLTIALVLAVAAITKVPIRAVSLRKQMPRATSTAQISETAWYQVTKVVDGDTIKIDKDGKEITVRLIGLDTPEIVDPRKPVQCFAKEASEEMKKVLGTGYARLEMDPSQGMYDKYGRLLAYVYAPLNSKQEGLLLNKYMIAEGYGHEYTYDLPYKYQQEFKDAEKEARIQKKGLWAPGVCEDA